MKWVGTDRVDDHRNYRTEWEYFRVMSVLIEESVDVYKDMMPKGCSTYSLWYIVAEDLKDKMDSLEKNLRVERGNID